MHIFEYTSGEIEVFDAVPSWDGSKEMTIEPIVQLFLNSSTIELVAFQASTIATSCIYLTCAYRSQTKTESRLIFLRNAKT